MSNRIASLLAVSLLAVSMAASAQDRGLKVLLLYDMEGMSGATDFRYTSAEFTSEYAEGRRMMTDDVNAAIAGLVAGGATEIVVVDGHGSGNRESPDVLVDELLPPATMHYRNQSFDIYMDSYDSSTDAIVAIGMHPGAGNNAGFLAHTYTAEDIGYWVNGVPFNESMLLAAGAARLKIPLIMISGDDQLEREVRKHMPWVRYATVKHARGLGAAEALPKNESAKRIETTARDALRNLSDARLPDWPGPYRFTMQYQDANQGRAGARVPGAELSRGGLVVEFHAADFEAGYRLSTQSINLASDAGWNDAVWSVIEEQPNAEALKRAIAERWYARWIDPMNLPSPGAATGTTQPRYWGAW